MNIRDIRKAKITDKNVLHEFRTAERLRLLRKFYRLFYAAVSMHGERKFERMLITYTKQNKLSSSIEELYKVAEFTGLSIDELQEKTRKREIVESRQVAMYLSKKNTKESLATIGRTIGNKDHATVLHACKTVNNLIETDKQFLKKWGELIYE